MNIRRLQSGRLDAPRSPRSAVEAPPPPPRQASGTAPLEQHASANTTSKLNLEKLKDNAVNKPREALEELERRSDDGSSGNEDAGSQAQDGSTDLASTVQQGVEQGALSRRMARFGADLVRAVPVVDKALDAAEGAVDALAKTPGALGRVGKVLQGADNLWEAIEKADLGILASGAASDAREQVAGISDALRKGDHGEAVSQARDLARGSLDLKEGAGVVVKVGTAATSKARQVAAPVAQRTGEALRVATRTAPATRVAQALAPVARPAVKALQGAGNLARPLTRVVGTAGRAAIGTVGKAAGRFVPGVNVAIAAADTYTAARTLANPRASTWNKARTSVTALGSIVAATNIPVVSQIGAAISIGSSLLPDKRPRWLGGK